MANTLNCPSCSAPLEIEGQETTIHCEYCGATVIVPAELRKQTMIPGEVISSPTPHPSQPDGPHGKLSSSQMRQVMVYIRAGQLENAKQVFQEGTGVSTEMAGQTVDMINNQLSASNQILPAELATIMKVFAETAIRNRETIQPIAEPRRRSGGLGCWLVLVLILLAFYLSYTSISPFALTASLISGKTGDPVVRTAIAPIHAITTAIAPMLH